MTQQVQELINKIKTEGIQTAEKKAHEIEEDARRKAQEIADSARKQADQILARAQTEAKKTKESGQMALKQAARDTLLSLRKEIEKILQKLITQKVDATLTSENLTQLIREIVKNASQETTDIRIGLNDSDFKKLSNGFLSELQKNLKGQSIRLESADDIGQGFTISFDGGKSSFDFTDASLAEYLSTYLNPQISALVKEASS